MTVTKQQQLEWFAKTHEDWPFVVDYTCMSHVVIGFTAFKAASHRITREEWQQERDKMRKTPDVTINNKTLANITATKTGDVEMTITAQDSSWHELGDFPPVGCECELRYKYSERGIFCEWESGVILFFGDEIFVVKQGDKENAIDIKSFEFRPLRTDREMAVDDMVAAFQSHYGSEVVARKHAGIAELLYDAGYRKEQTK